MAQGLDASVFLEPSPEGPSVQSADAAGDESNDERRGCDEHVLALFCGNSSEYKAGGENERSRKCDLSSGKALAFTSLRRRVADLIDLDIQCAMGIARNESVEPGAQDEDLPNSAFDRASSATRLRAAVNRRPMLATGCLFANWSTSFSSSRRIIRANGLKKIEP